MVSKERTFCNILIHASTLLSVRKITSGYTTLIVRRVRMKQFLEAKNMFLNGDEFKVWSTVFISLGWAYLGPCHAGMSWIVFTGMDHLLSVVPPTPRYYIHGILFTVFHGNQLRIYSNRSSIPSNLYLFWVLFGTLSGYSLLRLLRHIL